MAGQIKIKNSRVGARIPGVSELTLGELAINTFDGKLFFKKNNGSESLQSIVTTDAQITGSINLTGTMLSSATVIENTKENKSDVFLIKVDGVDKISINSEGTLILSDTVTLPSGTSGALSVSGSNLFIYL